MCPVIRISDRLYSRLEAQAVGFETPSSLIERLLEESQGSVKATHEPTIEKPQLIFNPGDEVEFKKRLLINKQAIVKLHRANGLVENRIWRASRMTESSNIRGNLWSGLLRGWKKKGIIKAELSIALKT